MNQTLLLDKMKIVEELGRIHKEESNTNAKNRRVSNYKEEFSKVALEIKNLYNKYNNLKKLNNFDVSNIKVLTAEEINNIKTIEMDDVTYKIIFKDIKKIRNALDSDDFDIEKLKLLKKSIDNKNYELDNIWKRKISSVVNRVDTIINTLGSLVTDRNEVVLLRMEKKVLENEFVGNAKACEALFEYPKIGKELLDSLQLDDDILNFLNKLSGGRKVTLNDMNMKIYKWLITNGFADKIKIIG